MRRRDFLAGTACAFAETFLAAPASANVPVAYSWAEMPPFDKRDAFIAWGVKDRGEDPKYLGERFDRFRVMVANKDVWDDADKRAFLMVPREEFVLKRESGPCL